MFNDKQLQLLNQELDPNRIKSRSKGSVNLSYLEGFDIIDTANRVFGYGNWSYSLKSLSQVSEEKNQNQNVVVCYKAIVTLTINDLQHNTQIIREDVGFGTGIAKSLAEAHENSAKEAVTDGLKRAFRSYGNQFGNSLYNKSTNHQTNYNNQYNQSQSQNYQQQNQQYNHTPPHYPQNQKQQPMQTNHQSQIDYTPLFNLGLTIVEQGSNLVVLGNDIFAKKEAIKQCGFTWQKDMKLWIKPKEEQVA
jgi:DNA repair and recombination protein RAD52